MNLPRNIDHVKKISEIKYEIGLRKEFINSFQKSLSTRLKESRRNEDKTIQNLTSAIQKFEDENLILQERMDKLLSNSTRKKYNFPIIDVPASGNSNWWEGAYTLCFVYSKHNGNFILRGWRGEVMKYLKKNYSNYFCYISMWSNGCSRGHWKFWKDNVSIFEPKKLGKRKEWKYRVVKYSGSGIYHSNREKELEFKRLPKRWIKEFDEL